LSSHEFILQYIASKLLLWNADGRISANTA
jgi:hypothetical protein